MLPLAKHQVAGHFDAVARRYDLLQRMNPGYRADLARSAQRLRVPDGGHILDLCCGTGLSTEALRAQHPRSAITALDAPAGMLEVARAKPELTGVRFLHGDAHDPRSAGASGPFDGVFMGYGIRNMSEPDLCLARVRELLVPGGSVAFHEYLLNGSPVSRTIWNAVAATIITPLGWAASGSRELFAYLRKSVLDFDTLPAFEARLRRAGFVDVRTSGVGGWQRGILHNVVARKPG